VERAVRKLEAAVRRSPRARMAQALRPEWPSEARARGSSNCPWRCRAPAPGEAA